MDKKKLIILGVLMAGMSACVPNSDEVQSEAGHLSAEATAYVLGLDEGEILQDSRGRTTIIKVSPETGAIDLAWMTQDMPAGSNISVHRHDLAEEILFMHKGSGTFILGDDSVEVEEGATIYVPPGTWHGMENPDDDVHLVFVVSPPGLDSWFREMFWRPGEEPKALTPEQISEIERKHDARARGN